jgi:DNA replicative helicase MCM subunit Mcm2 (Cdc46/Mcm family)
MNFENLPHQITEENEHLFLAVRNKLQIDLAKRYAESRIPGITENKEDYERLNEIVNYWMNTYSKIFSNTFKDLYHEDKDLFHEYLENPEKVLNAIEGLIYEQETV